MTPSTIRVLRAVTLVCAVLTLAGAVAGLLGVRVAGLGLVGSVLVLVLVPADLGAMTWMAGRLGRRAEAAQQAEQEGGRDVG